jgi:predicted HAD superfamily Cof-like phosphohydrolase
MPVSRQLSWEELAEENTRLKAQLEILERQRKHEYYEKSPSYFQMVKRFHEIYGLKISSKPINLGDAPRRFHQEYSTLWALRYDLHNEEFLELRDALSKGDLVEITDAICDLIYVLCGTAVSFGIPLDECFAEVQRSNMSKLGEDGKPIVREDGKILKGPDFSPPDLKTIIYGTS